MAGALSPVLNSGVSGTQATQQTSGLEVAADLVGAFARSISSSGGGSSGPSFSERQHQLEVANRQKWADELDRANQLRAQGKSQEADFIIRHANIEYAKITGKDPMDAAGKSVYQASTGDDPEFAGMSFEERAIKANREDSMYQAFLQSAPQGMSDAEKDRYAVGRVQQLNLDKASKATTALEWSSGGQEKAIRTLNTYAEGIMGVFQQNPGMATIDTLKATRAEYEVFKTQFQPPVGLSAEARKDWDDSIKRMDNFFDWVESKWGSEGLKASIQDTTNTGLMETYEILTKASPTLGTRLVGLGILNNNPDILSEIILKTQLNQAGVLETLGKVFSQPMDNIIEDAGTDPESVVENVGKKVESMTPVERRGAAISTSTLYNGMDMSTEIKSNPKTQNEWFDATLTGITAFKNISSGDALDWVTSNDYSKVFTPELMKNIASFKEINPTAGALIESEAINALRSQAITLQSHLASMEAQNPIFVWSREQGTFTLNPNPVPAMDGTMLAAPMQRALDRFYGGDVNKLIKDKGERITREAWRSMTIRNRPGEAPSVAELDQRELRVLSDELAKYFATPAVRNAEKYAQALKTNEGLQQTFFQSLDPEGAKQRQSMNQEQGGPATQTTQSNRDIENVYSVTASNMDKYEGGGDYDTLFGHSQRDGGKFAGIKPTQMTIAQLLDFTSPSGEYGQWVKGKVGRVATPIGRFQFVGSTIREVAKDLGIDINNTVFNEETQNLFFNHYAKKIIGNKTGAEARKALINGWEGFKNVPEAELDQMVAEIKGGNVVFGPGSTYGGNAAQAVSTLTSSGPLLPPTSSSPTQAEEPVGPRNFFGGGSTDGVGAEGSWSQEDPVQAAPEATGPSASQVNAQKEDQAIAAETQKVLENLGLDQSTPVFNTYKELLQAVRRGEVADGQMVVVDGQAVEA